MFVPLLANNTYHLRYDVDIWQNTDGCIISVKILTGVTLQEKL